MKHLLLIFLFSLLHIKSYSQQTINLSLGGIQIHEFNKAGARNNFTLEKGGCAVFRVQPIGSDVLIRIEAPDGKLMREYSQWQYDGPLPVKVEAETTGIFSVEVLPFKNEEGGTYMIQLLSLNSASPCDSFSKQKVKDDAEIISWIKSNAIPLATVEPGNDFRDLMPLEKVLQNIQVLGLGESTHGTAEFFQYKHRMLRFLCTKMNYTVFALEDGFTEGLALNQYILRGTGNIDSLLKPMHAVWNTKEMVDMIEWMRTYNRAVTTDKKIKFYGIDPLDEHLPDSLTMFFEKFVPGQAEKVKKILSGFMTMSNDSFILNEPNYKWIGTYLKDHKTEIVKKSGEDIFNHTIIESQIMLEQIAMAKAGVQSPLIRDSAMALNVQLIATAERKGTRMLVWAHNGHISAGSEEVHAKQTGYFIRKLFGEKYYAMALMFNEGSFSAIKFVAGEPLSAATVADETKFREFSLPPAPQENLEHYFASANIPIFILDLRGDKPSAVNNWMNRIYIMRSVSTRFDDEGYETFAADPVLLKSDYDGIFFIQKTGASQRRRN